MAGLAGHRGDAGQTPVTPPQTPCGRTWGSRNPWDRVLLGCKTVQPVGRSESPGSHTAWRVAFAPRSRRPAAPVPERAQRPAAEEARARRRVSGGAKCPGRRGGL